MKRHCKARQFTKISSNVLPVLLNKSFIQHRTVQSPVVLPSVARNGINLRVMLGAEFTFHPRQAFWRLPTYSDIRFFTDYWEKLQPCLDSLAWVPTQAVLLLTCGGSL